MVKLEVTISANTRRRYTEELKREAVRLMRESAHPVAQVARDLGIPENVLYRWRTQHQQAEATGTTRATQRAEAEDTHACEAGIGADDPGTGLFNTCGGVLHEGIAVRYRAIQEHDRRYPIRLMCRALAVSPAGYYAWSARPESVRGAANRALVRENPGDPPRVPRDLRQSQHLGRPGQAGARVSASTASRSSCRPKGFGPRP